MATPTDVVLARELVRVVATGRLLAKPLVLTLLVGVEDEALSPDARFDPGVGAQLVLAPWTLGDADTHGITLDADLNYFVRDCCVLTRLSDRGDRGA